MKYLLLLLFLVSCTSQAFPTKIYSDASVDAEFDSGTCEPLTCESLLITCGVKSNKCGQTIDCGVCPAPYKCGAQDLQNYSPTENICGLGCRVVKNSDGGISSDYCKYPFLIEHECPNVKEMIDLMANDWNYECNLIPHGTTDQYLHFCCGL